MGVRRQPERGLVGRYDSDYGVSGVIPAKGAIIENAEGIFISD